MTVDEPLIPDPHPPENCGPLALALLPGRDCPTCGTTIPPRQYRRIGPHHAGAGQNVIVVETPRPGGGVYYLRAYVGAGAYPDAVKLAFQELEAALELRIRCGEADETTSPT